MNVEQRMDVCTLPFEMIDPSILGNIQKIRELTAGGVLQIAGLGTKKRLILSGASLPALLENREPIEALLGMRLDMQNGEDSFSEMVLSEGQPQLA